MCQRVLAGYENELGLEHASTLNAVSKLANLNRVQGKLDQAGNMYQRALAGKEKTLGADQASTLDTVNNLGNLYGDQDKLDQAEHMYKRALTGREKALGTAHRLTLDTVHNLENVYFARGKLDEAERNRSGWTMRQFLKPSTTWGISIMEKASWTRQGKCTSVRLPERRKRSV